MNNTRQNDWVAVELNSPAGTTVADIIASGINAKNTVIHEADYYKNIPQVQERFTKNGEFNETDFNQFYESCLREYNAFSDDEFLENYIQQLERSPYDWTNLQASVMDTSAYLLPVSDKNRTTQGLGNIWQTGTQTFSDREVAQAQKVRDSEGNELDWTPNDKGGLIKALFRPTIALAIYEEDVKDANGRIIHSKGDLKLDWKGDPYTETLEGKDSYGRSIVTISDTLTEESTFLNKIDPFDSDSIEKSLGGTVMETALKIAPWIIGSFTGTTQYLAAFAIFKELNKTMPGFIKGVLGTTGSEADLESLNRWENYMLRFQDSKSDASRNAGFWHHENIGDIIASSFSQLAAQKTLASMGKVLSNDRHAQTRIGQEMSKIYMAMTSTADSYKMFREAGVNETFSGVGMLATFAAMYGLQSIGYFNKWMWKNTWLDENREMNKVMDQFVKEIAPKITGAANEVAKSGDTAAKQLLSKKWFKTIYDKTKELWSKIPHGQADADFGEGFGDIAGTVFNRALNEGIEETMEEFSADIVKASILALDALGVNVSEENKKLDFGFSPESILSRYAAAFAGGAIGGSIFEMYNRIDGYKNPLTHMGSTLQKIVWGHRNGFDDIMRSRIDYLKEKGGIPGNVNLSASKFLITEDTINKGYEQRSFLQGDKDDNQQTTLYNFTKGYLNHIFDVLDSNLLKSKDAEVQKAILLAKHLDEKGEGYEITDDFYDPEYDLLVESGALHSALWDLDRIGGEIFQTSVSLFKAEKRLEEATESSEKNSAKKDVDDFKEQLKKLQNEYEEIRTGKRADYYMNQAYCSLNQDILTGYMNETTEYDPEKKHFVEMDVRNYASLMHGIDNFDDLSDARKEYITAEFNSWYGDEMAKKQHRTLLLANVHYLLSKKFAKQLTKTASDYKGFKRDTVLDIFAKNDSRNPINYNTITAINKEISDLLIKKSAEGNPEEIAKIDAELESNYQVLSVLRNNIVSELNEIQKSIDEGQELTDEIKDKKQDFEEWLELFDLVNIQTDTWSESNWESYKNAIVDFHKKYNSSKRMSSNPKLLLDHYVKTMLSRLDKLPEIKSEVNIDEIFTNNIVNNGFVATETIVFDALNKSKIKAKYEALMDAIKNDPSNVKTLVSNFLKDVRESIIAGVNREGKTEEELESLIQQRWNELGIDERTLIHGRLSTGWADIEALLDDLAIGYEEILPEITTNNNKLLEQLLNELSIDVNGKPLNIFTRYQSELQRLRQKAASEFEMDSQAMAEMKAALNLIKIATSLVQAAGNGHNSQINKYRQALKKELFAELDQNERDLLISQLAYLHREIKDLVDLAERNAISLTEEQKEITYNMAPKLIKSLFDYDDDDEDKSFIGKEIQSILGDKFNIKKWWKDKAEENGIDLTDPSLILNEKTYPVFVDLRRQFYKELRDAISSEISDPKTFGKNFAEKLGSILSNFKSTKFKRKSEQKTEDDVVQPLDTALYFLSIIGADLNLFEKYVYQVSGTTDRFLPYFSQEYAAQLSWAAIQNKELFNGFLEGIKRGSSKSDAEYISRMMNLSNFMMIDGVAGSGKSQGVARLLAAVLKLEDPSCEIVALSTIDDRIDTLAEAIETENKGNLITGILDNIFMKPDGTTKLYSEVRSTYKNQYRAASDNKIIIHYDHNEIPVNEITTKPILVSNPDTKRVVYFIDEVTQVTEDQMQALVKYVEKLNANGIDASIIGLGDSTQSHAYNPDANNYNSIADCNYLRTPQLSVSLRKGNRGKRDNLEMMERWIKSGIDALHNDPSMTLTSVKKELTEPEDKTFIWYKTNDAFYGEDFVTNGEPWVETFLGMKSVSGNPSRVLILTDNISKYNSHTSNKNVIIKSLTDAQGGEYDYAVIDLTFSEADTDYFESLRNFYTAISRSRMGSVIVKRNDKTPFGLASKESRDASIMLQDPNTESGKINRLSYKKWRIKMFGNIEVSPETSSENGGTPSTPPSPISKSSVSSKPSTPPTTPVNSGELFINADGTINDDTILEKFKNSKHPWAKVYNEAEEKRKSEDSTVLTDEEFYGYLKSIPEKDFIIHNNVRNTERISKKLYIDFAKIVSNFVLNRNPNNTNHTVTASMKGALDNLVGSEITTLFEKSIKHEDGVNGIYYIAENGEDKKIIYYVITSGDQNIAIPIGISNTILSGAYLDLKIEKINTIVPITSNGEVFVPISNLSEETGVSLTEYGMFVGNPGSKGADSRKLHRGVSYVPMMEPVQSIEMSAEKFYDPIKNSDGSVKWLTQGWGENPEQRVNEIGMQVRLSFTKYLELARAYNKWFFDNDRDSFNILKNYFTSLRKTIDINDKIEFSDSTDLTHRKSINEIVHENLRHYRIISPYANKLLLGSLFRWAKQTEQISAKTKFNENVLKLLKGNSSVALGISFKTETDRDLNIYLIDDSNVNGYFSVFVEDADYKYHKLDIKIPVSWEEDLQVDIDKIIITLVNVIGNLKDSNDKAVKLIKALVANKQLDTYLTENADLNELFKTGNISVGFANTYVKAKKERKFFPIDDGHFYAQVLTYEGSKYLPTDIGEFFKKDEGFKHNLYANLYEKGGATSSSTGWKVGRFTDSNYFQTDVIGVMLPGYRTGNNESGLIKTESSDFCKSLDRGKPFDSNEISLASKSGKQINKKIIDNVTSLINDDVYASAGFINKYLNTGNETISSELQVDRIDWREKKIWLKNGSSTVGYTFKNEYDFESVITETLGAFIKENSNTISATDMEENVITNITFSPEKGFKIGNSSATIIGTTSDNLQVIVFANNQYYKINKTEEMKNLPKTKVIGYTSEKIPIIEANGYYVGKIDNSNEIVLRNSNGNIANFEYLDGTSVIITTIQPNYFTLKPRIEENNASCTRDLNGGYVFTGIKMNGVKLNSITNGNSFLADKMYDVQSMSSNSITVNGNNVKLKPGITFNNLEISTPVVQMNEADVQFKDFIQQVTNVWFNDLGYSGLDAELIVDKDINATLDNLNNLLEKEKYLNGAHHRLEIVSGNINRNTSDEDVLSEISAAFSAFRYDIGDVISHKILSNSSIETKISVSLRNGKKVDFAILKSSKGTEYKEITGEPMHDVGIVDKIINSSLSEDSKIKLQDALNSGKMIVAYSHSKTLSEEEKVLYEQFLKEIASYRLMNKNVCETN